MLSYRTKSYLREKCKPLVGKTVIVTGANSGIGLCAAEELAFLGAHVIMACRNLTKAEGAMQSLLKEQPKAKVSIRQLDISKRSSITSFVEGIISDRVDVHALVNNAGVFKVHGHTEDGEDIVMGTNFTGTRELTEQLLPYLQTLGHAVKVTFTSSISYRIGSDAPGDNYTGMSDLKLYATSKRRLTRYALDLSRRLSGSRVKVILTHPGISITQIVSNAYGERFMKIAVPLGSIFIQPTEKSALAVPLVISNDVESGSLYGPCGFLNSWGYPSRNRIIMK